VGHRRHGQNILRAVIDHPAMAEHLGMTLETVVTEHQAFPATQDIEATAGLIPKGTVGHYQWRWRGIVGGNPRLTMTINWYMETAHLDDDEPPPGVMLRPLATPFSDRLAAGE
jgi:hypothetical protein